MDERRPDRAWKLPRKITERSLGNIALYYLKRYTSTVSQLRKVLLRRVERNVRALGQDRDQARAWVEPLIEKLVRDGFVNDVTYAETKAHSLRAAGRSSRVISERLRIKGVAKETIREKVAVVAAEVSEETAAKVWARKKRLGPFRREASQRAERRQRDLASLARAGFSYAIAKGVIDGAVD